MRAISHPTWMLDSWRITYYKGIEFKKWNIHVFLPKELFSHHPYNFISLYMLLKLWGKLCILFSYIFIIGLIIRWKSENTYSKCQTIFQRTLWNTVLLPFGDVSYQSLYLLVEKQEAQIIETTSPKPISEDSCSNLLDIKSSQNVKTLRN